MPPRVYKNSAGKRVPSVTTVIANLGWNKGPLMYWAWNEGIEGRNYRETSETAADIGTIAHAMVEAELKKTDWRQMVDLRGVTDEQIAKAKTAYSAWREWAETVNFKLLQSEHSLVSNRHNFGGTIDVAAVKKETCIVDLKTSKDVYADHRIQISAYGQLWNENYPENPIKAYYLLRIDKHTGGFAYYYWPELDRAWEAFLALLKIHQLKRVV